MTDYTYLTPTDTAKIVSRQINRCQNMNLVLARYIPHEVIRDDDFDKHDKYRGKWLNDLTEKLTASDELLELMNGVINRWAQLTSAGLQFEMRLLTPLIVGLGGKGPLEFGITLHHTTGLPTIPGSALKGLCRNYALQVIASEAGRTENLAKLEETLSDENNTDERARLFRTIFGTQSSAGEVVFYDAIVTNLEKDKPIFGVDVMTPHFNEYYRNDGSQAPHDADSPVPVSFLTVLPPTDFGFAVGLRKGRNDVDAVKRARIWLRNALSEFGAGAKTAAGYGAFGMVK